MEKSNWRKDLELKYKCYRNDCPLRKIYGSGKNIPIKEGRKCPRKFDKGCVGNE